MTTISFPKSEFRRVLKLIFLLLFLFLTKSQLLLAVSLRLPSILSNHMVIQQQSSFTIWGWAKAGDFVKVLTSWDKTSKNTKVSSDGNWELILSTPFAGGPYEIKIIADTIIILKDIMVGEVWVCSGQSNMQMPFNGYVSLPVIGSNDYIAHGKNENIRLFTVERTFSKKPEYDCHGSWAVSDPSNVGSFSAIGYVFGKYLQEVLEVPIGLILSCWGGSAAESWTDKLTLESQFKEFDLSILRKGKVTSQSPTVLFNAMIHPLLNFTIRGVIWYQGTSNRDRPDQYSRLFPAMIKSWRDRWGLGDFPFYFVQIAPYSYRFDKNTQSALLREAQLKTLLNTKNTGMAVTMDVGDSLNNHPSEKVTVGKRLAYWALAKTYGMDSLSCSGPVLKDLIIKEGKAILNFYYSPYGLTSFGKELQGFVIAGNDRVFRKANAIILGKTLVVWNDSVMNPVAVRYCWDNYALGTLFNTSGLPASSFRTDDWNIQ